MIRAVVTRGFSGQGDGIKYVVTRGYDLGTASNPAVRFVTFHVVMARTLTFSPTMTRTLTTHPTAV